MQIKEITVSAVQTLPTYEEYLARKLEEGASIVTECEQKIQGEDAAEKSSPSLFPLNDRSSPLSEPYDATYIVLNTIGGKYWKCVGDWIQWDVDVPQSGLYRIVVRFKQTEMKGLQASRCVRVNGEIPFQEARRIGFGYDTKFQVTPLQGADGEAYYFYLEQGHNTIAFENSLGIYTDLIQRVEASTDKLDQLYQQIVVITGTEPDKYRDYELPRRLPNLLGGLEAERVALLESAEELKTITGSGSDKTSALQQVAILLMRMIEDPYSISRSVVAFRDNITALGQWARDMTQQSLTVDYLLVSGSENPLPKANGNLWQNFVHEVRSFIGSFTNDYNVNQTREEASDNTESKTIEVWVTTGRDQLDVIRRLVNESFSSEKGRSIELKLVNSDVLLPATCTGQGPDVVVQTASTLPINFAFRGAARDLTKYADFPEVSRQFLQGAMDCFEFNGGYYALPDQMSFPVLFYRSDILEELNIEIPQTWDDLISVVPFLQSKNMDFYLDTATPLILGTVSTVGSSKAVNAIFLSLLYQMGGEIYSEDGDVSMLNSDIADKAFNMWTDFFTKHQFPVAVNFVTRFRLGEIPISIVDFSNYNQLVASAPEIEGKWAIATIPGIEQADGTIRRDTPVTTSASMIIENSVQKRDTGDGAWEFLKWWTSSEIQTEYAKNMEAILGSAARYPVANLEAFQKIAWPSAAMKVFRETFPWVREVRQVPGSYITGRYVDSAFYEIINDISLSPTDILFQYSDMITGELTAKRKEFGLE